MDSSVCEIPTASASRYLQQLCKHFAHEIPTSFSPTAGSIAFPLGPVALVADDAGLTITVSTDDAARLDELKDVVVRHLVRFAFRETLVVAWTDDLAPAAA